MATRHEVAAYPAPWFGELPPAEEWKIRYDETSDTLNIHFGEPRAAVSFEVDECVWLRSDPITSEVVGIEIEDLREEFLAKRPDLVGPAASFDQPSVAWGQSIVAYVRTLADTET